MTEGQWSKIRQELYYNFPRLSSKNIENILDTFKEADKANLFKMEPYILKYRDIILRIGVKVPGEKIMSYVPTPACQEIEKLLSN